jgi:hypothetical protein
VRLHAYVLAADPAFLAHSVRSYYDAVERIVVSYDEDALSWTGTPLPVEHCLEVLDELDVAGKCVLVPGRYARLDHAPLDNDTFQRQEALEAASDGADWVLQLDTDEVLPSPGRLVASVDRAQDTGCEAVDYPARWLYARAGSGRFLEASTRFGRPAASFPGPLAVRAGTALVHCRQVAAPTYRVDLRPWNTDPFRSRDAVVHEVVPREDAVLHYSWVRTDETMRRKFGWSGHTAVYSRPAVYERWVRRAHRPVLTAVTSPLRRQDWYRLAHAPELAGGEW